MTQHIKDNNRVRRGPHPYEDFAMNGRDERETLCFFALDTGGVHNKVAERVSMRKGGAHGEVLRVYGLDT